MAGKLEFKRLVVGRRNALRHNTALLSRAHGGDLSAEGLRAGSPNPLFEQLWSSTLEIQVML